jgi:predicted TIM-barrel fold metal-dependent hydrolase
MTPIVDSHAHIMLEPFATLGATDPAALMAHYADCGIDQVWASSVDALIRNQPEWHRRCNDRIAALQREFDGRLVGLATVDPRTGEEAARELERAVTVLGLKGLKLHGWLQPVSCCDPCLEPLFETATRCKVFVLFHDGTPPYTSCLQIAWLAARYRDCPMILGHAGLKDLSVNAVQAVRRHPNLYMQTDATTLLALKRSLPLVGADRILFGSDGGFGDLKWIDYNLLKIRKWNLDAETESMILGANAERLTRWSETR